MSIDDQSTVAVAPDTGPNGTSTPADAVISRLNAFDGLFLRAEHLNRMQAYTSQVSVALGRTLGAGVVEGFGIGLDGDTLVADPGLAFDPAGRPLRTRQPLRRSLSNLTPNADSIWWIELHVDEQEFGDEPVRGVACADPCSGCADGSGGAQHPYIAEGVRLGLREEKLPAPADLASLDRRGFVAQQVFDRERPPLGVWPGIVPTASGTPQFLERRWHPLPAGRGEGIGRPDDAVPIGLLLPSTDFTQTWELDVWTVRRDLGEVRSQHAWLPLLGMRPWSVFVAQILQFQQLLADRLGAGVGSAMTVADINEFLGLLTSELKSRRTAKPLEITTDFQERLRGIAANEATQSATLSQLGLRWLPPALFLPVDQELPWLGGDGVSVRDEVIRLLDRTAGDPHAIFCVCGPWDIGRLLEFARHADRIDLVDKEIPLRVFVPFAGEGRLTDWVLVIADDRVGCLEFSNNPEPPIG